jgi:hypothetical protein
MGSTMGSQNIMDSDYGSNISDNMSTAVHELRNKNDTIILWRLRR